MENNLTEGKEVPGEELVQRLLKWFDNNHRILPWRSEPTPYRVWISEIMLQQTRVEAVKPYFERFVSALPDIQTLADCPEEQLLKLWEGLGYYNRVRNLQKAAKVILEMGMDNLPEDYEELQKLPGIGSYTAGAISSIAFGKKAPAVDGNVLRVFSRVFLDYEDVLSQKTKKKMAALVLELIPMDRPGDFNQALMELGATVCVPNGMAKCKVCPLEKLCQANLLEKTMELPVKSGKKPRRIEKKTVFILLENEKVALHQRENKGLLAGLYEFPNTEGHLNAKEALAWAKEQGFEPLRIQRLEDAKHIFSHVEWRMRAYAIGVSGWKKNNIEPYFFIKPEETKKHYPIPAAFLAYTRYMNMKIGYEKVREKE